MSIVRALAGYSMGRADMVRRVMAKKKNAEMARERTVFINGLTDENGRVEVPGTRRRGIDDDTANKIFDKLTEFANYAFNKSHAACYAHVAYQTAYLKANYPTEYLAALLVSLLGSSHKIQKYVTDFAKYGIKLLPPDVNKSSDCFEIEGKNVRFALSALKNVGLALPKAIAAERRKNGLFKSFEDFMSRMSGNELNKRNLESLIKAGAFDGIFANRRVLLLNFESMLDGVQKDSLKISSAQVSFFSGSDTEARSSLLENAAKDFSPLEKLAFENEFAGMYLSGHPMDEYVMNAFAFADTQLYNVNEGRVEDGAKVNVCGVISRLETRRTKSGVFICTMNFSDLYDTASLTAFESVYRRYEGVLREGAAICASAQVRVRDEESSLVLISAFSARDCRLPEKCTLYVRLSGADEFPRIREILKSRRGNTPVCIFLEDVSKVMRSDSSHGVSLDGALLKELAAAVGADNVRIGRA